MTPSEVQWFATCRRLIAERDRNTQVALLVQLHNDRREANSSNNTQSTDRR